MGADQERVSGLGHLEDGLRQAGDRHRWGEDGLAGFGDIEQRLCLSLALWNDDLLMQIPVTNSGPDGTRFSGTGPTLLFCENETSTQRLSGTRAQP